MGSTRKAFLRGGSAVAISAIMVAALSGPAMTETTKQVVTGPVAQYWVDTTTSSGFSLGSMAQGGRPSMSSMMGMMNGGNGPQHSMTLRLGSSQGAAGEPQGDHLPPATLDAGNDLPLYYKAVAVGPSQPTTYEPSQETHDYEPPKGKILVFWGCGEHAPKDQPVVIDLAKITDPAQRTTLMRQFAPQVTLDTVRPPAPGNSKTFGEWPNEKSRTGLDSNSSLAGAHTVKANYAPAIAFTLDRSQDFLAPIQVSGNQKSATGAVPLPWAAIPGARGFVATVIGGSKDTVVMWTSAASQTGWMGMAPDYMTPGDIDRLTASHVLLPGTTTACTVPAEVAGAVEGAMYGITAYGGETNLSYPPRPTDPKVAWNIQWTTKIRYRSTTGGILGQDMPGMGGGGWGGGQRGDDTAAASGQNDDQNGGSQPSGDNGKKKKKGGLFGEIVKQGVGSFIP
ncbi:MAG: hypothetical protein JF615_02840 [Asticcacaulis sp.]|nr:hypothetical protein [Asticcacaulis sp.]